MAPFWVGCVLVGVGVDASVSAGVTVAVGVELMVGVDAGVSAVVTVAVGVELIVGVDAGVSAGVTVAVGVGVGVEGVPPTEALDRNP